MTDTTDELIAERLARFHETERDRDRLAALNAGLVGALACIVDNAVTGPDIRMGGATDCYHVPMGDVDTARALIAKAGR